MTASEPRNADAAPGLQPTGPLQQTGPPEPTGPLHSIGHCPICGGGLLGVRLCHGDPTGRLAVEAGLHPSVDVREPHGWIQCDECEAVWNSPSMQDAHHHLDAEQPVCPTCQVPWWRQTHWASGDEVSRLGWDDAIDPKLDWDNPDGDSSPPV